MITEFPIPTADAFAYGITGGPGRQRLVHGVGRRNKVGRITPAGVITEFPLAPGAGPLGIVTGPDGHLWIAERFSSKLARVNTSGSRHHRVSSAGRPRPLRDHIGGGRESVDRLDQRQLRLAFRPLKRLRSSILVLVLPRPLAQNRRMQSALCALSLLVIAGVAVAAPRPTTMAGRSTVYAPSGMVATSQPLASAAGLDALRQGGNAIDAAVAAAAVLSVTEPHMTGIGGDMFAIVWLAKEQKLVALNASGRAGSLMTREALLSRGFRPGVAAGRLVGHRARAPSRVGRCSYARTARRSLAQALAAGHRVRARRIPGHAHHRRAVGGRDAAAPGRRGSCQHLSARRPCAQGRRVVPQSRLRAHAARDCERRHRRPSTAVRSASASWTG